MSQVHVPALTREVLEYLDVTPNRNYVDATVNGGGHARAILERNGPGGKVLGIDWDGSAIEELRETSPAGRLILEPGNFADMAKIVKKHNFVPVHGVLFDLGLSSWHLEHSGRGFSFQKDEPLDMRYDVQNTLTACEIINSWSEQELERIIREYGEEKFSKQIAREIATARSGGADDGASATEDAAARTRKARPIATTFELVHVIKQATPQWYHGRRTNPATKTFQALRIAVNHELENLERALPEAVYALAPRGRLVIITFHSLEDRIAKNFFKDQARQECGSILTKKVIRPGREETNQNPRARSAKLRALEKK